MRNTRISRLLTQNVHHCEAVVKRQADEESTNSELPEGRRKGCGHACYKSGQICSDQGRNAAEVVGHPTKYKASYYGTAEENGLSQCGQGVLGTNPVQLREQKRTKVVNKGQKHTKVS